MQSSAVLCVWKSFRSHLCVVRLKVEELELEAELARANKAAGAETLRDTAPVIEGSKVMPTQTIRPQTQPSGPSETLVKQQITGHKETAQL